MASDLEKLLFRDKLLIVSLNNVLLRVDNLLGLSSTPLFLLKSKISNDTLFFKKDVSKLILLEVSFNLDWISKLRFGEKELVGENVELNGENELLSELFWLFFNLKAENLGLIK